MKKLVLIAFICVLFFGIFIVIFRAPPPAIIQPNSPVPTSISPSSLVPAKSITVNEQTVHYAYFTSEPSNVSLIPNFSQRYTSSHIMDSESCGAGMSGGFYDTSNQPLGLFMTDESTLRKRSKNLLINGFVAVTLSGKASITREEPDNPLKFVLQTGPLIALDGTPLTLAIQQDEYARRMIAAVDARGAMVFLTLFRADAIYSGPLLGDVPALLSAINAKELLNIVDAVNLDGGSASAFYSEDTRLTELTPVGSFFCIKT